MADRLPVIYGLEFQSRALSARVAETEKIQFLCGTQTLRNENQIHLVEYDEETSVLNKLIYPYPHGEIWDIVCSYTDSNIAAVCSGEVKDGQYVRQANLIRLDGGSPDQTDTGTLDMIGTVPSSAPIQSICWHPDGIHEHLATADDKGYIAMWSLDKDTPSEMSRYQLDSRGRVNYSTLCWNSHHNYTTLLVGADSALFSWDTRAKKVHQLLDHHHGPCVRDIDCNPNRPYYFVSCGDDCSAQFWDWRKLERPLLTCQDHSHWVWSVRYNTSYDQLVVTGSSDSQVLLTRASSVASEPLQHLNDDEDDVTMATRPAVSDGVIAVYEEHEDSVYSVKWSSTDAWVFASLSYDGRLVINHVPTNEKYSILTA